MFLVINEARPTAMPRPTVLRTSITFFVKDGAKPVIRAALADGGYGTTSGNIVNLINEHIESWGA